MFTCESPLCLLDDTLIVLAIIKVEFFYSFEKGFVCKPVKESVGRIMEIHFNDPYFPVFIYSKINPALEGVKRVFIGIGK
jgi:hypothetical protein